MRIGIYGGTFNPPHKGHTRLAEAMLRDAELDKILIIPAGIPPHKESPDLADDKTRLAMCTLAFSESCFEISDIELKRDGKSYTVDTLKHYYSEDSQLYLLCGTDMLLSFHKWYRYEDILSLCTLCVISREDEKTAKVLTDYARDVLKRDVEKGEIIISHSAPVELSSTLIRDKISRGEDVSAYLEKRTYEFIKEKGLYF